MKNSLIEGSIRKMVLFNRRADSWATRHDTDKSKAGEIASNKTRKINLTSWLRHCRVFTHTYTHLFLIAKSHFPFSVIPHSAFVDRPIWRHIVWLWTCDSLNSQIITHVSNMEIHKNLPLAAAWNVFRLAPHVLLLLHFCWPSSICLCVSYHNKNRMTDDKKRFNLI